MLNVILLNINILKMKRRILFIASTIFCTILTVVNGQNKDKAVFRESKPGFFQNSILRDDREVREKAEPVKIHKNFAVDLSNYSLPNKVDLYKNQQWHNPPVSQGNTSTCWCFSTTSFLESEVYRLNKIQVKLSEMYTVYWEYVEKARRFVRKEEIHSLMKALKQMLLHGSGENMALFRKIHIQA